MRNILRRLGVPSHLALANNAWAPTGDDGKLNDDDRNYRLEACADLMVDGDYEHHFNLWKSCLRPDDLYAEFTLQSRLLIGHGNPSAFDIGLSVHHTWGAPIISGSSLKGLLSSYVDIVYGPDDHELAPWEQPEDERSRIPFTGLTWRNGRIQRGPGEVHRILFGAPDADDDAESLRQGFAAGAARGQVIFHDALYVPGSADQDKPFARDVLTVHQSEYYRSGMRNSGEVSWPNDYDSPKPVGFISIRPKTKFLLALSGPSDAVALASELLAVALANWGIGAKTSAGYGIGQVSTTWRHPDTPPNPIISDFVTWLKNNPSETQRELLSEIRQTWLSQLNNLEPAQFELAAGSIRRQVNSRKLIESRDALIAEMAPLIV
ncbi:MAG: type III-B CRISPR module RAMP protein Cmr6 [Bradymonadaceae bacterium]|nr:type III-B CRISPR module RAMP protein Cmr6 [Lujinxingiaceae bacterium]